jgi:hypothetical protein
LNALRLTLEQSAKPKLIGGTAQQTLRRTREQTFPGAVDQPQALRTVERENGDVDLRNHFLQQAHSFERANATFA